MDHTTATIIIGLWTLFRLIMLFTKGLQPQAASASEIKPIPAAPVPKSPIPVPAPVSVMAKAVPVEAKAAALAPSQTAAASIQHAKVFISSKNTLPVFLVGRFVQLFERNGLTADACLKRLGENHPDAFKNKSVCSMLWARRTDKRNQPMRLLKSNHLN
jgi:hypothetical protein